MKPTPRHVSRLVEDQVQRWLVREQARRSAVVAAQAARPIVTISRQAGAHGTEVARRVAARLGFALWDQELVQQIAAQTGTSDRQLSTVDEREINAIADLLSGLLMGDPVTGEGYLQRLLALIRVISKRGNAVVVGRGAQFVVEPEAALRVRVIGAVEARLHTMMLDAHLDERQARARIERIDHERLAFVRHRHLKDAADPGAYDVLVNTSTLSVEQAAEVVVGAYRAKFGAS